MLYIPLPQPVRGLIVGLALTTASAAGAVAQDMPPLPSAIEEAGTVRVGVKCDYPPEGFLNNAGDPVGVEVSMAHQIAKYAFGEDAEADLLCVTSSNRVPALLGDKVDLIIATMGINDERAEVVDFTDPYAWTSSGLVVREEDEYNALEDFEGHRVAVLKGAWQIPYFEENHPDVELLLLDSVSDSLQSLMQGRVEGYAHDTPVLMSLDRGNDRIRVIDETYRIGTRGAAVRPGEEEWLAYVNASIKRMDEEDRFRNWFETYGNEEDLEVKLNFWDMSQMPDE